MGKWFLTGGLVLFVLAALAWFVANTRYRAAMDHAKVAWSDIAGQSTPSPEVYTPEMVADLPEIAQRYFGHAIAVGTPLYQRVELKMTGEFLLGERDAQQSYALDADQILAPPSSFVWIAQMSKGALRIRGSDGLHGDQSWTRFWLFDSLAVANLAATPDLDRSAAARPAIEAIWAPATLLPANGAIWTQTGPETAQVTFSKTPAALTLTLEIARNGAVRAVWTQRWSDANPAKTFQLQPFGAIIEAETTFDGFTIPSRVRVGNMFGTPDFLPFFVADLTRVRYF